MVQHADIDHTGLTGVSGNVAADAIWDAAGDLAVGSGANTAARLAIGAVGGHVSRINGVVAWDSGTSNPGSAVAGDRFWRSDLGRIIYYDGTRWLSVEEYSQDVPFTDASQFTGLSASTNTIARGVVPPLANGAWLTRYHVGTFVATTNNGTNNWTVTPTWGTDAGSFTNFTTFSTSADTADRYTPHAVTLGSVLDSTARVFRVNCTKTLSPGNLIILGPITFFYRHIIT